MRKTTRNELILMPCTLSSTQRRYSATPHLYAISAYQSTHHVTCTIPLPYYHTPCHISNTPSTPSECTSHKMCISQLGRVLEGPEHSLMLLALRKRRFPSDVLRNALEARHWIECLSPNRAMIEELLEKLHGTILQPYGRGVLVTKCEG